MESRPRRERDDEDTSKSLDLHVGYNMPSDEDNEDPEFVESESSRSSTEEESDGPGIKLNDEEVVTKKIPMASAYNRPRGPMTAYAFFVQNCREEYKKKHPDENIKFAEFCKECAERWTTMSEIEKQRFHEMAENDKKRFDLEMQSYLPPEEIKRRRKRYQMKDPKAPKRWQSAFFLFCNEERLKIKADNPEYTMEDIAKELGRRWDAADPETKSKYESLSEEDMARYDREMMEFRKDQLALRHQPQAVVAEVDAEGCRLSKTVNENPGPSEKSS